MSTRPLDRVVTGAGSAELGRVMATASVVYDGLGLPRADAAVVVQRAPGVSSVVRVAGAADARTAYPDAQEIDCGFAVSPPVVNAHTHLDLSDMPFTPGGYVGFIGAVIAHGRSGGRGPEAAERGLAELVANGTSVVGDIVASEGTMELLLRQDAVAGVAYWEVFAPRPEDAGPAFEATIRNVERFRALERPGGMRVGISPHAPHTVSVPLLVRLAAYARAEGLPIAIHVAESPAERELHVKGTGELARSLAAAGFPFAAKGVSPVRYLYDLGVLDGAPTLIHMVQVDEEDVRLVARAGSVVVHCPRSNAALACGEFPWLLYARHGVELAFGTDSRGSSPDLDVTNEVAAALAAQGARLNARAGVRAAVKGGYKALAMVPPRVVRGAPARSLVAWAPTGADELPEGVEATGV